MPFVICAMLTVREIHAWSVFSLMKCKYAQDTEKSKVVESIASVIQPLPPEEEIPPIQAIVSPVVEKLAQALHVSSQVRIEFDAGFLRLSCFIFRSSWTRLVSSSFPSFRHRRG
jgi:hypothetical protein